MTPRLRSAASRRAALGLAVAGVAALLTVSAVSADGEDLRADRQGRLVDLVRAEQTRVEERTAALDSVRAEVAALSERAAAGDARVARALGAGDALAPAAGLEAAAGRGLTVVLDDAPRPEPGAPLPEGIRPDDLVVHQQDVQAVVNALWEGGADGDEPDGPAGDLDQRGALRRQHADPAGPGLLPAVPGHRDRRSRRAAGGPGPGARRGDLP